MTSEAQKQPDEDMRKLREALAVAQIQYDAVCHYRDQVSAVAWQKSRAAYGASAQSATMAEPLKKAMYHDNAVLAVLDQNWKALEAIKRQIAACFERSSKAK